MGDEKEKKKTQDIMCATYQALSRHGYADLSIQRIADEFDKGKSVIYHHFDDKEDLMLSFLEHLIDEMEEDMHGSSEMAPEEELDDFLDKALCIDDKEMWDLRKALMEMRLQAPYNKRFAERFRKIDEFLLDKLAEILEDNGVENPCETGDMVLSIIEGLTYRKMTTHDLVDLSDARERIKKRIGIE